MSKEILNFLQVAQSAAASLRVKSAMNPLLWFASLGSAICIAGAYFLHQEVLQIVLIALVVILVLSVPFCFVYFMLAKPDYLRSEEYQIKKQSLEMFGAKDNELAARADHVALIANPTAEERGQ